MSIYASFATLTVLHDHLWLLLVATCIHVLAMANIVEGAAKRAAVHFQLDIQLDNKPEETRWEVRKGIDGSLVDGVTYNYYGNQTNACVSETFFLESGSTYYFLIADIAENGMSEGSYWKLTGRLVEHGTVVFQHQHDGNYGRGMLETIEVPSTLL